MLNVFRNQRTLAAYEDIALEYAESTRANPTGVDEAMLRDLAGSPPGVGTVLELGSGPGWDADFVESLGTRVRRTDATAAFCNFQRARGKQIDRLNAITDGYTDPAWPNYTGVMALYVLQHIERHATDTVLHKVAAALRPGGKFLVSVREGSGDHWETGESGLQYHLTLWQAPAFEDRLRDAGLEPYWSARSTDAEGPWLTIVARAVHRGED